MDWIDRTCSRSLVGSGAMLRSLARHPVYALTVILVVGLAVGANTAVFSVVNAVLLRPLPYAEPSSVVVVWQRIEGENGLVSPPDYLDWKRQNAVFATMGAYTEELLNLTGAAEESERLPGIVATPSFFEALGVRASIGRVFGADDARLDGQGSTSPVIISDRVWRRHFGSDPGVLGKVISLNGRSCEVVGVLPPELLLLRKPVDAILPLALKAEQTGEAWRGRRFLTVVARLAPGHSGAMAQTAMDTLCGHLARLHPETNQGRSAVVTAVKDEILGPIRPALYVLQGAVFFILLIAGANLAHVQLVHTLGRAGELATRQAMGATRERLMRELVAESAALALVGGALGLGVAWGVAGLVAAFVPIDVPRIAQAGVDWAAVAVSVVLAGATGVGVGAWSARRVLRLDLQASLKQGGRGAAGGVSRRTQDVITFTEVALCVALLVGAGLALRGFLRLQAVEPGFLADTTIAFDLSLPVSYADPDARARFFEDLVDRTRHLAGIRTAGVTSHLPLSGEDGRRAFSVAGTETEVAHDKPTAEFRRVSDKYFDTMGIRILRGRSLMHDDDARARGVAVVNQAFVRRFLATRDPLRFALVIEDGPRRARQIVGVVSDVRHFGLERPAVPTMYVSHLDRPWPHMVLVARVEQGDPTRYAASIRSIVAAMDDMVVPANVRSMRRAVDAATGRQRFVASALLGFAVAALLLAGLGLHGVVAHAVETRTREIALRLAVGAAPRDVVVLVIGHGLRLLSVGLAVGAILSIGVGRLLQASVYGIRVIDPLVLLGVATVLAGVMLAACAAPAWRAYRSSPARLLRA